MPVVPPSPSASSPTLDDVLAAFAAHHPDAPTDLIERASLAAHQAHTEQRRASGDPYITHPLSVAHILASYGLDASTIAAALLHDTVEDTPVTREDLVADFDDEIATLVDGVTKLDRISYSNPAQAQAATIRKMVIAIAADVRVLLIKLADRLHNIRTLDSLRPEKQARIARETLDIYAPLAHRLGIQEIKHELEDRCFAILHPGPHAEIMAALAARAPEREAFIAEMTAEVSVLLSEAEVSAQVTGRPKHPYSIYRKMTEQDLPFEDIHDLIGLRVITANLRDAYATLGLIHSRMVPVPGRFKDYIAVPKVNFYRSLHTTVIGPDGKPLEVQIRTQEMHQLAESGIAAHWRYKEAGSAIATGEDTLPRLDLISWDSDDPEEFVDNLKLDLYRDEVFVLTPDGDVKSLPLGATPVDFAYSVHTEVGHRCTGARINGRLVPLSTKLTSGDIVEILTSKADSPSHDWLSFVRTSRARSKIRQWFVQARRDRAIASGRELLLGLFRRTPEAALPADAYEKMASDLADELGYRDSDSLYAALGEGSVSVDALSRRLTRRLTPEDDPSGHFQPRRRLPSDVTVAIEGQRDMLVFMARCCTPVPGDDIIGYITVGRGVAVHRADCTNAPALASQRERAVEATWVAPRASFVVWIQIEALDRTRLLRDVTDVISDTGGNITAASSQSAPDRTAVLRYEVELSDPSQLPRLLADLRGTDGVYSAFRMAADPSHLLSA